VDRWLAAVFGIVGAAGLADLVVRPFLQSTYPDWTDWLTGLAAFALASSVLVLLAIFIAVVNKMRTE